MNETAQSRYNRDTLLKDLRQNAIEIHFTKTDGSMRVMKCTLMPSQLPPSYVKNLEEQGKEKDFHRENQGLIAAWDIELQAWRSFRVDSVVYCTALENY